MTDQFYIGIAVTLIVVGLALSLIYLGLKLRKHKKVPIFVVFTIPETGEVDLTFPPEQVKEYVIMPSGEIVVKVDGGESYWFNSEGIHPKSYIVFKE
jgi:hypothetical protein